MRYASPSHAILTRFLDCALAHGFHTVVEGILYADHYGAMLQALHRDYADRAYCYYFDVSFEESLRRHATKPEAVEFGEHEMRDWYRAEDYLPDVDEIIIDESSLLEDTVASILNGTRLLDRRTTA